MTAGSATTPTTVTPTSSSSSLTTSPIVAGDKNKPLIKTNPPPRRFISSILGGDIPYGSRRHILTRAERKEYPITSELNLTKSDSTKIRKTITEDRTDPCKSPVATSSSSPVVVTPVSESGKSSAVPEPVVRCSVIQRTPKALLSQTERQKSDSDTDIKVPASLILIQEPEQEQPIDYHVPKRKEKSDEEIDRRQREARRSSAITGRSMIGSIRNIPRSAIEKINGIICVAAGHGRSGGGSQSGNNQGSNSGSNGCGGSINFTGSGGGGSGSGGSNGSAGMGGSGAGGGMGGRDGRSNYGPNSPPTGSLPPFYESLKGGNSGMNTYNSPNNYLGQNGTYGNIMNTNIAMDSQELTNLGAYTDGHSGNGTAKQYSMLQNAAYGIVLKDEQDLEYDNKMDPLSLNSNLLGNSFSSYDVNDSMMVDIGSGVVDPLQFTATLTFSTPSEHAFLENLSDAVDLTNFLQRLPNDEHHHNGNNEIDLSSTPSLTPDSVSIAPVDNNNCMDNFTDHMMMNRVNNNSYDGRNGGYMPNNNKYNENPPSYHSAREMHPYGDHHDGQSMTLSGGQSMSFQSDLDSHNSNMSLPSPGTSTLDSPPDAKPIIQSVSGFAGKLGSIDETKKVKLQVLQQRVSIKLIDFMAQLIILL